MSVFKPVLCLGRLDQQFHPCLRDCPKIYAAVKAFNVSSQGIFAEKTWDEASGARFKVEREKRRKRIRRADTLCFLDIPCQTVFFALFPHPMAALS